MLIMLMWGTNEYSNDNLFHVNDRRPFIIFVFLCVCLRLKEGTLHNDYDLVAIITSALPNIHYAQR